MGVARRLLNAAIEPFGYRIVGRRNLTKLFWQTVSERNRQITRKIAAELEYTVQEGVFEGLKLIGDGGWGDQDLIAKLLGTYEKEIHPAIAQSVAADPDCVVNIGCADGYYAVGLRRILTKADIFAFDIDPSAEGDIEKTQKLNGVTVHFSFQFEFGKPFDELFRYKRPFFIIDCEGFERGVPDLPRAIRDRSILLIETHDGYVPGVTGAICSALKETHEVNVFSGSGRDPHSFSALRDLGSAEKFLLLSEFRGIENRWIYAVPRDLQRKDSTAA